MTKIEVKALHHIKRELSTIELGDITSKVLSVFKGSFDNTVSPEEKRIREEVGKVIYEIVGDKTRKLVEAERWIVAIIDSVNIEP